MTSRAAKPRKNRRPLYLTAGFALLLVAAEAAMMATWTGIAQHPDVPFDWVGFFGVLIGIGLADIFLTVYMWSRLAER